MSHGRTRLAAEQRALANQVDTMTRFIDSDAFKALGRRERFLLVRQLEAMERLDHILLERIALPGGPT